MSYRVITCLFLLCIVLPRAPVTAVEPAAGLLTQEEAVRLALEGNPDLLVSTARMAGIRERVRQAREFPATAIEFDFDQQIDFLHSEEQYIGFTQELEFPTRMGLRVNAAEEDVRASQAEHRLAGWETALAAKLLYQDLALAQELVALSRENLTIAERLAEMADGKYELGTVGKLEVLRAGVEAATAANDLSRLEKQEQASRMHLNHLLGRTPIQPLETTPLARGQLAHQEVEELNRQVDRYRDSILAPAEEAFTLASASYSEGEIESLELLDSRRTLQAVRQAVIEGSKVRLRPILMTELVMIFGALPLVLGNEMGSEIHRPLAIVYIGGFLLALLFSKFTLPALYYLFESWRKEPGSGFRRLLTTDKI